ncbi:MAG: hypothetical protein AB7P22_18250 [Vicinamibacterales bacterium]
MKRPLSAILDFSVDTPDMMRRLESSFDKYIEQLEHLGIVDEVLIGTDPDSHHGYIINVVNIRITSDTYKDERYLQLIDLSAKLECELTDQMDIRVAQVDQANLPILQERSKRRGICLEPWPMAG